MRHAYLRVLVLCAAVSGLAASAAAQISGKLLLGAYKPAPPSGERAFHWELENGFKEVRPDRVDARRELAVVLLGEGAPQPGLDRVEVTFSGGDLLPSTIVARAGATILFRNDDEIAHELYAEGMDGLSAEATAPRGRRSVNVKTPGSFALRDKLLPHVSGRLHVLPNLVAVGTLDDAGQFTFKVPAGKYVLKVLHGDRELASQPVELTGADLTLDPIALTAAESK